MMRYSICQSICAPPGSIVTAIALQLAATSVELGLMMRFYSLSKAWILCFGHANKPFDRELKGWVMMAQNL
jgi:hypothetical protein